MTDEAKALVEQTINVAHKIVEEEYLQLMAEMTQRHMEAALKARNEQNSIIKALSAENERLREVLREVFEQWAGSEGFIPETAPEGYLLHLTKRMADIARAALGETE